MRRAFPLLVLVVAIGSLAACHSSTSPSTSGNTAPSPSYAEPSQVAWSATATTAACTGVANNWNWTITIKENAGVGGLSVDYLDATIDGAAQPRLSIASILPANGTFTLSRVVCLSSSAQHTVAESLFTSYKGQISTDSTVITLQAKP